VLVVVVVVVSRVYVCALLFYTNKRFLFFV